jgi:hypothetical protein
MSLSPHCDAANLPDSKRPTNIPNIPSNISRERPPQYNQQVCGCHCHTGNGCYCTEAIADPNNSSSNGRRRVGATISDTNTINVTFAELDISDDNYDSDSDIDLDSESSSSSFVPYQYYTLGSPEFEGTVEALRDHYDFLRHVDDIFHLNSLVDDNPDDLDSAFNGPMHLIRSPRRLVSPAASMEVNFSSGEQSLRSSMTAPAMHRSGTPSYYTRCVGFKFHEPTPPSRFLELTPPLSPP